MQHGKPQGVVRDGQLDAREGQARRPGVAERPVVPMKPGNAGGGKGPQFKTNARRKKGPGDWATYQLRKASRDCRRRYTQKRRLKPTTASMLCTTRFIARIFWLTRTLSAAQIEGLRVLMVRTLRTSKSTGLGDGSANWRLRLRRRRIVRLPSDAFISPRPTANFGRLASQPCATGSPCGQKVC